MENRKRKNDINYEFKAIVVVCDTKEKILAEVLSASPLKINVRLPRGVESVLGKSVIVVTEKQVTYADVITENVNRDLSKNIEAVSRRFSDTVIESLYNNEKVDEDIEKKYKEVFDTSNEEYTF